MIGNQCERVERQALTEAYGGDNLIWTVNSHQHCLGLVIHGAAAGTHRESQRMSSAWRRRERDPLVGLMLAGQQSRPVGHVLARQLGDGGATDFNG